MNANVIATLILHMSFQCTIYKTHTPTQLSYPIQVPPNYIKSPKAINLTNKLGIRLHKQDMQDSGNKTQETQEPAARYPKVGEQGTVKVQVHSKSMYGS